ncbi:MAG: DUF2029 domain-containing protein [Acidobacteria bacterium]|nr:DUF2029 domain-containing protein [Acidobacteriota bacterium]
MSTPLVSAPIPPWKRVTLGLALALAAVYFLARGPWRAVPNGSLDFSLDFRGYFYIALRTFACGGDPYQPTDLLATAGALSAFRRDSLRDFNRAAFVYPPGSLIFAPIGLLPLREALWVWLLLQCAGFAGLLYWSRQLCSATWTSLEWGAFLACALALAPVHTSLHVGNMAPLTAALTAALFLCLQRNSAGWGGLALGLLMIKPTFGIPGAVLALILARWRLLAVGTLVSVLAAVPAFWRLGIRHTLLSLLRNLPAQTGPGMPGDESFSNPAHFHLLNLRSWFHGLVGPGWAELLTGCVLAGLLYALFRFRRPGPGLPTAVNWAFYWTLASCFICLALYHRFYDAALLAVPLATAVDLAHHRSPWVWAWAAALAPFAVPGTTFLHLKLGDVAHRVPLVEFLLVRHETLAILLLACLAIAALHRQPAMAGPQA